MAAVDYPKPIRDLIVHLKQLPGIGPRSAERIAVWMMQQGRATTDPLSEIVSRAGSEIVECSVCGFFSTVESGCAICEEPQRDDTVLCIVENPTDILPLERSGAFRGQYHSLRGRISPLDGIGPEDLRIGELLSRLQAGGFVEVILALGSDVEGEATANYLAEILQAREGLSVSRLAQGLPAGGGLESADELTLMRALQGSTGLR